MLTATVSKLTGLRIDHFVLVSFLGFVAVADALDGIPVNLCHAVNDSDQRNRAEGLQGGSGLRLSAGRHTLRGKKALAFVRQRHFLPHGDLDRTKRQRYFLSQALGKVISTETLFSPSRQRALVDAVANNLLFDDGLTLVDLARLVAKLDPDHLVSKAIPIVEETTVEVGDVQIVDPARVQRFVGRIVNPSAPKPSTRKATTSKPPAATTPKAKKKRTCID